MSEPNSEIPANIQQKLMALNTLMANRDRSVANMYPGYFGGDTKHQDFYSDYGYPTSLTFDNYHQAWKRNGLARAGINKPIETCWQEFPQLLEKEDTHDLTAAETKIVTELERLQLWSNLSEADMRSRVGEYAGVIFRYRDSLDFDQPVGKVGGGLLGISEIIPCWQKQLEVAEYYTDVQQENYGKVKMYTFRENAVTTEENSAGQIRMFNVHPDRVHIWSRNSTIWGQPALEAGFNDLLTMQKIIGAGGEGFWKNAKAAPVLQVESGAKLQDLSRMLGTTIDGLADKLDEIIADYQRGYDKMLMIQGMEAKSINVDLPDPEHHFNVALMSLAASLSIPVKILVGSQTGERASTEDAKEWNKTCNSRRTNYIRPNVMRIIEKWVQYGILDAKPWYLLWGDLTESTTEEKATIVSKMADINQKSQGSGDGPVFTHDEMREVMGWDALLKRKIPKRAPENETSTISD